MALQSGQSQRSGRVTDADGRGVIIDAGGVADTLAVAGSSAAAPAAASSVVSIAAPPAGIYDVEVTTYESAAPDANVTNMRLRKGVTLVADLHSSNVPITQRVRRVSLDGTQTLNVGVGAAAGGAGAIYTASIRATRVE